MRSNVEGLYTVVIEGQNAVPNHFLKKRKKSSETGVAEAKKVTAAF